MQLLFPRLRLILVVVKYLDALFQQFVIILELCKQLLLLGCGHIDLGLHNILYLVYGLLGVLELIAVLVTILSNVRKGVGIYVDGIDVEFHFLF